MAIERVLGLLFTSALILIASCTMDDAPVEDPLNAPPPAAEKSRN